MVRNRRITTRRKRVACLGPDCGRMMVSTGPAHRFCRWCTILQRKSREGDFYSMGGREHNHLNPWKPLFTGVPGKLYREE